MPLRNNVAQYLSTRVGAPVTVLALETLDGEPLDDRAGSASVAQGIKTYGYGKPVRIRYTAGGGVQRAVLHTMAANPFGHERRADRAAALLLAYDTFNEMPRHIQARDVGIIAADGALRSLGDGGEFFLLTDYAEGDLYADDLQRLCAGAPLTDRDLRRARDLAAYLAAAHAVRSDDDVRSARHLRDVLGSGEGILGLSDSYSPDAVPMNPAWLARLEQSCVAWRWRLKRLHRPAAQIHGDFHPFNILFDDDALWLLDRSRGGWGEPADDVTCLAINYLFFSLQRTGQLSAPFDALWNTFWTTYLERTGDQELLSVVAPFFAWRVLVLASPQWYDVPVAVRTGLMNFVDNVLAVPTFDPWRVNDYLRPPLATGNDDAHTTGLGDVADRAARIGENDAGAHGL